MDPTTLRKGHQQWTKWATRVVQRWRGSLAFQRLIWPIMFTISDLIWYCWICLIAQISVHEARDDNLELLDVRRGPKTMNAKEKSCKPLSRLAVASVYTHNCFPEARVKEKNGTIWIQNSTCLNPIYLLESNFFLESGFFGKWILKKWIIFLYLVIHEK
jgi:hypothetical protein